MGHIVYLLYLLDIINMDNFTLTYKERDENPKTSDIMKDIETKLDAPNKKHIDEIYDKAFLEQYFKKVKIGH